MILLSDGSGSVIGGSTISCLQTDSFLGSLTARQEQMVIYEDPNSHTQSEDNYPFTQQGGQTSPALGSDFQRHSQISYVWLIRSNQQSLSIQQVDYGYVIEPESHAQFYINYPLMQQAGHQPFPALGSFVNKHGQVVLVWLINSNLHVLSFVHVAEGYQQDPVSQTLSDINESFIQKAVKIPFALGSSVVQHSHLSLDIPTKYYGSFGHLQPQGQFDSMHVHESYDVQQVGHYPFPALGSSVLKHGQLAAV
ncbi:MAG: hypothetical protein EZS28_015352 [Streblomastix strix]|uniref:Uncharacterized protein n=1 Tax=Streblomastix strix TaxID=222440 RepID=A0A5J4W340_9EUKA|nr:MAG: hypothetical protein EZS28_015352 [Streblomastix strix]